ncbi:insulinase family protein [Candidatus Woesearchaeota archaeon]|nr:insulinase family protein [Candidatus Woesearchaeota archaeon]
MDFERRVLKNGLRVFIERTPVRLCAAYLNLDVGWVNDTIPEISHVFEHMQGAGCKVYGKRGALNYAGTNAFADFQNTCFFYHDFFPDDLLKVLKNLSKALLRPHVRWLDREKKAVGRELDENSCPEAKLDDRIFAILSPKHDKLFSSTKVSLLNLDRIDVPACCDFFDSFYSPSGAFLYVSGGLNSGLEKGIACFERIKKGNSVKPVKLPVERVLKRRVEFARKNMEKPFVKIAHQFPGFSGLSLQMNIAKNFLFNYLNEDFGPLNSRLRDRFGLCYSYAIGSSFTGNCGEVILRVETDVDNLPLVEKEYLKTLTQIALKGISKEVLDTFRKKYKVLLIKGENQSDLNRVYNEVARGLHPADIEQAVAHVTKEDVAYIARMMLDRGYVVAKGLP